MDFGKIEKVPLKDVWLGEATHFTPWLAQNLEVLSDRLGMDLELETIEAGAGDFSVDITARDPSTSKLVVIENQFGATDHRHLGQIITYSSVLNAGVVVWIAELIRPEHKAAIDFLNQNLKEGLQFYAVEVSVIRIGDSKPAITLNIVSMPTQAPNVPVDGSEQSSETKEKYRSFFQQLIDDLRQNHRFTNARAGQPQNWYTFSSENSRLFKYSASFASGGRVRVEVYIDCGNKEKNEQVFDCLLATKDEIEREFGSPLSWERLETRKGCRVAIYRDGDIDAESDVLAEIRNWTIEKLLKFKSVFPIRFKRCQLEVESITSLPPPFAPT